MKEAEQITTIKLISYPAFLMFLKYLNIQNEAILILSTLLVLDVVTALIRVFVTRPQNFSTRIGIVGILSKLLVILIPLVMAFTAKGIGYDLVSLVNAVFSILIVYETWSILGNIMQIRTKDVTLTEYDAVSMLIKTLQDFFKNMLYNMTKGIPIKSDVDNK